MSAAIGDFLKPQDFLSPYCPYAGDANSVSANGGDRQIEVLADFADKVERGSITCEYIKSGRCAFATFAIEHAIGNESTQMEMEE